MKGSAGWKDSFAWARLIFLVLALALISSATRADPVRLARITEMFENSEAGFAYVKHCGDFEKTLKDQPFFMADAQVIIIALAREIQVEHPEQTMEQIKDAILKRSAQIQSAFDDSYKAPGACTSSSADAAHRLVDHYIQTSPENMDAFLQQVEKK